MEDQFRCKSSKEYESNFANAVPDEKSKYPKVIFAGNNLNPDI